MSRLLASVIALTVPMSAFAAASDADMVDMLAGQQKQIDEQANKIAELEQQSDGATFQFARSEKASINFYGHISPVFMYTRDGNQSDTFTTTHSVFQNRLGFDVKYHYDDHSSLVGTFIIKAISSGSNNVDQTSASGSDSVDIRNADLKYTDDRWGAVSMGRGDMASDNAAKADFLGSVIGVRVDSYNIGGNLNFINSSTGADSGSQISDNVDALDSLSQQQRLRLDSPNLYGFTVSAAAGANNNRVNDAGLRYQYDEKGYQFEGRLGYTSPVTPNSGYVKGKTLVTSLSTLLNDAVSVSVAYGKVFDEVSSNKKANFHYIKTGFQNDFWSFGKSAVAIDFGEWHHFKDQNAKVKSASIGVSQTITSMNLNLYAGYRLFDLTLVGTPTYNLHVYHVGAMFTF